MLRRTNDITHRTVPCVTHVKNGEPGFDIHDGSIMNYATCFARDCDIEKVIEAAESGRWTDWEAIE